MKRNWSLTTIDIKTNKWSKEISSVVPPVVPYAVALEK